MSNLTNQDFETLMIALDVWAKHADDDKKMGMVFMSVLKHRDNHEAAAEDIQKLFGETEDAAMTRQEQAILLKAKLVQLKHERTLHQLFAVEEER